MSTEVYIYIIVAVAFLIMLSAVAALVWASRTGQFRRLNQQSTSIFTEEEPLGVATDAFPGKNRKSRRSNRKDSASG